MGGDNSCAPNFCNGRSGRATDSGGRRSRRDSLATASDDGIVSLVRADDIAAFGELYRRYHPQAHRYARRLSFRHLSRDEADDVVAEAMRKVLAAIVNGCGPSREFRAYLFTTIRSVMFSESVKPRAELGSERDAATARHDAEDDIELSVAINALASLPDRWQRVLWATEAVKLPLAEAAAMLEIEPSAIAMVAMRAREALRVAFVRQHLPAPARQACERALDLLARRPVAEITPRQRAYLDDHLAACDHCRNAAAQLDEEIDIWTRTVDVAPLFTHHLHDGQDPPIIDRPA